MKVNFKSSSGKLYLLGVQIPNNLIIPGELLGLENTYYKLRLSEYEKDGVKRTALWANPIEPGYKSVLILWKQEIPLDKAAEIAAKAQKFWEDLAARA
ncbi:MAG: hypothetical protein KatS3mg002_1583 [Candidatus Woesearchaeota archaeon]|nr:MAG: hypothetical protein KatS3mg002_1583 [Candidatus Woesearchaeota archaeon]